MADHEFSVEERLRDASSFMETNGISAVSVHGTLGDGRSFEGISFATKSKEIGLLCFANGEAIAADMVEQERRLGVAGFINEVVRPVQRAASTVYEEGSDLLDERFDALPGML